MWDRPTSLPAPSGYSDAGHGRAERRSDPAVSQATPVVFVVDDDVSVRESLELSISCAGWQPETFASARAFLARPVVEVPSCLVLDISLPDLSGLEVQERLAAERAELPIIFITGHGDVPMTVRAMKAGAADFLTKPLSDDALLDAIRHALERSRTTLARAERARAIHDRYASLSRRERQVMALVAEGRLNKQVAATLRISEITVKSHRGQVMRKMGADSLADLVRMAATLGLQRGAGDRAMAPPVPSPARVA